MRKIRFPVIDIRPLMFPEASTSEIGSVVDKIREASRSHGFFHVVGKKYSSTKKRVVVTNFYTRSQSGHEFEGQRRKKVFDATKDLFKSDMNVKQTLQENRNGFTRGFFAIVRIFFIVLLLTYYSW